jgi:hypothetical protein
MLAIQAAAAVLSDGLMITLQSHARTNIRGRKNMTSEDQGLTHD